MIYSKNKFLKDVAAEANAIKEHATKEEISKLNYMRLDPEDKNKCIYGQMAGHCRNERAVELITKCCKRFLRNPLDAQVYSITNVPDIVNGTKLKEPETVNYYSTIETYITLREANNSGLISYLKGETNKLEL